MLGHLLNFRDEKGNTLSEEQIEDDIIGSNAIDIFEMNDILFSNGYDWAIKSWLPVRVSISVVLTQDKFFSIVHITYNLFCTVTRASEVAKQDNNQRHSKDTSMKDKTIQYATISALRNICIWQKAYWTEQQQINNEILIS